MWKEINIGMTKDKVVNIIGMPDNVKFIKSTLVNRIGFCVILVKSKAPLTIGTISYVAWRCTEYRLKELLSMSPNNMLFTVTPVSVVYGNTKVI